MANPDVAPSDFTRPGHIFPLKYCPGGVLKRGGHTEATIDLARLAGHFLHVAWFGRILLIQDNFASVLGLKPCGFLCEINNDDGTMSRRPELEVICLILK